MDLLTTVFKMLLHTGKILALKRDVYTCARFMLMYGKPIQYCKVITLQLKQINLNLKKIKEKDACKEEIQMANKHEKMLNITHYYRNANQNYHEVSSHAGQNGHHQKVYKQ